MQILNDTLQSFLAELINVHYNLLPVSYYLFYTMATISLVKLGLKFALAPNENIMALLSIKLMKLSFTLWLITNLPSLNQTLLDSVFKLAGKALGVNSTLLANPSAIVSYGLRVIIPIRVWLQDLSWTISSIASNIVNIFFGLLAIVIILAAFYYLAYQMFMALVDFYFTAILTPIFLVFSYEAVRGPLQHAVKLFTITMIIYLFEPCLNKLTANAIYGLNEVITLVMATLLLATMTFKINAWSLGMLSGVPTASAGDLAATFNAATTASMAISRLAANTVQQTKQTAAKVATFTQRRVALAAISTANIKPTALDASAKERLTAAFTRGGHGIK